jgi:hypothetical protein
LADHCDVALVGSDIFHGALTLDQLYSARPAPGYGDYRCPVGGLQRAGRAERDLIPSLRERPSLWEHARLSKVWSDDAV